MEAEGTTTTATTTTTTTTVTTATTTTTTTTLKKTHHDIDRIFYNDFPIVTDQEMGLSQENRTAIKLLQESIHFDEDLQKY